MSINPNEPANFTPTLGSYRPLSPFRFWCQKVLPLVYDDSLSYYELLNKVVDYLNKAMEDVETLHGDTDALYQSFVQLQGYVNTYFSSLDVQEEIDNKLDEMAENGNLTELISPFMPDLISEWLSEHITPTTPVVDNTLKISGAAADSKTTGDNIDILNNYINELKTYVKVDLLKGTKISADSYIRGDAYGSLSHVTGWSAIETYVDIKENTKYILTRQNNVQGAYYDYNKEFISGIIDNSATNDDIIINTPANAKYFRISCKTEYINYLKLYEGDYNSASLNDELIIPQLNPINDSLDDLKGISDLISINLLAPAKMADGRYIRSDNGDIGYNSDYSATETYVEVEKNVEYSIARKNQVLGAIYDSNYEFIEGIQANDITESAISKTMPSNAKYIRLSCPTEYIGYLKMFKGVYDVPSLYKDVHVPEMLECYNEPVNPTNYLSILPDVNEIDETCAYKMYFSKGSSAIPANLPFDKWITDESAIIITLAKDDKRVTGTNAGSQQILIGKNFVFIRHYTTSWQSWNAIYLRIRVGGGYNFNAQFSSLTEAIAFATKYKNAIVEVGNGTYDLYNEFRSYYGNDFFDNETASSRPKGLHLTNGVQVICSSGAKITFNYPGNNANVKQQFSPICYLSDCYDGFVLENANIECSNCRYVVHDDPGDTTAPYHNVYKNCKFYIDNTNNTDWTSTKAIGGGLGRGGHVMIEDCICKVNQTPDINSSIISYHVDVYTQEGNNTVEMKGCFLDSGTFAAFYGGNKCDYIITNNSMYGNVLISPNPGQSASEDTNINVYAWNNINRANI